MSDQLHKAVDRPMKSVKNTDLALIVQYFCTIPIPSSIHVLIITQSHAESGCSMSLR